MHGPINIKNEMCFRRNLVMGKALACKCLHQLRRVRFTLDGTSKSCRNRLLFVYSSTKSKGTQIVFRTRGSFLRVPY